MSSAFNLHIDSEGIATLVFDLPDAKLNTLSKPVLEELEKNIEKIGADRSIKALAIKSGKPDSFVAGLDLKTLEPAFKDPSKAVEIIGTGHRVFDKIAALPIPTIALIHGICLGGGTELALACDYRVASDHFKTSIGLPEVSLGIYPGWGGSQRLPRLVGLIQGLPFILGGKPVNGIKALKMKLIDAVVAPEFFDQQSHDFIKKLLSPESKKLIDGKRKLSGVMHALLEANPMGRKILFRSAEKDVLKKTKGQYPAPIILLDLIKETYTKPLKDGLKAEMDTFIKSLPSGFQISKYLIGLFFIQEALKKDKGAPGDIKPAEIKSAAVIGAGTMGSLIAWLFSNKDIPVRMKDIDWTALGRGFGSIYGVYKKLISIKKLKPGEASLKFHKISGTTDYSGFKNADIVVEAAVESLELKHKILKELEANVRDDTVIGSNTSSLRIADMGSVLKHPERFLGMHFFNPPDRMPLVEVVASEKTSPQAIVTAVDICRKLGKTPVVVKDCPGFLVNRIFVPGANEVLRMYGEGASFERLEKMMLDFGMPMSPFVLADEVGNDVGYKVTKVFEAAYGSRMAMPPLLEALYDNKLFGKKVGEGFYIYDKNGDKKVNPKVEKLRNKLSKGDAAFVYEDMRDRVFLGMINEASRCLDEQVVANASYLDLALVMGTGFPPYRGGLMQYADELGIDYVVETLKRFSTQYGDRFTPCEYLLQKQKTKNKS